MYRSFLAAALLACFGVGQALAQVTSQAGAPVETLTDNRLLPPDTRGRVYVMDAVFHHMFESRMNVFDGRSGQFLGMVPMGYNGHAQLSHDGSKVYTMTTYHSRMTRGERTDVVEVYDARSLKFEREVVLPVRRVQGLNYRNLFRQTTDGQFIVLQNATPAVSTSVVDVQNNRFAGEITATAGCWGVIPLPNKSRSFMTICGDGALLSIDLNDKGQMQSQSRSARMFPVESDPVFLTHAMERDKAHFISFNGNVYTADLSAAEIKFAPIWSILDDKDKAANWRPGGYNITDVHHASRRMYVLMHQNGKESSHKNPAAEIWVFDLASKKRLARIPGRDALALSIDQSNSAPRLLTMDTVNAYIYDIAENQPKLLRTIEGAGETALQIEAHPITAAGAGNG